MNVGAQRITINGEIHFFQVNLNGHTVQHSRDRFREILSRLTKKNGFEEPILWRVLDLKSLDDHF